VPGDNPGQPEPDVRAGPGPRSRVTVSYFSHQVLSLSWQRDRGTSGAITIHLVSSGSLTSLVQPLDPAALPDAPVFLRALAEP